MRSYNSFLPTELEGFLMSTENISINDGSYINDSDNTPTHNSKSIFNQFDIAEPNTQQSSVPAIDTPVTRTGLLAALGLMAFVGRRRTQEI